MRLHAEALLLAATIVCCGGSGLRTPSSGAPRSDNAAADVDATEIRGDDATRTDAGDAAPEAVQPEVVDAPDAQAPPRDIPDDPGSDGMEPGEPEVPRTDADIAGSDAPFPGDRMEDAGPLTAARCFADQLPPSGVPPIDYDQFHPVIGSHCKGTNHQDIQGVQRVVFAGDSITTGTPPTPTANWYRNMLAKTLAATFGLQAPGLLWQNVDLFGSGVTLEMHSGDFWSCAKFGARTDDLTREPHKQLITCNPPEERAKTTLIIMTVGGNDIFAWAQDLVDGVSIETLWLDAEKAVKDLEDAIHWVKDDPATFPNGVYVVFANTYEFSDADSGKDLANCPGAGLISMDTALIDPDFQALSRYFTTEYMRIAVETGTDMVFFGEYACGHGYMKDDPNGRCYRGPGSDLWLDITCMHPSAAGHAGLFDLFLSVIEE